MTNGSDRADVEPSPDSRRGERREEAGGQLIVEELQGIATLTMNRPERRNALSGELADTMSGTLQRIAGESHIRAVIVTGAGQDAFSSGTDLKDPRREDPEFRAQQRQKAWALNELLWSFPKPTIALLRGWCLGGGLELAISCDFRIAAANTVFGFPELQLGAFPGAGAPYRLPQIIGMTAAKDLLLSGRRFDAVEASRLHLVSEVVAPEDLLESGRNFAARFLLSPPLAIAAMKTIFSEAARMPLEDIAGLSDRLHRSVASSQDSQEGGRAFSEKRPPVFRGL